MIKFISALLLAAVAYAGPVPSAGTVDANCPPATNLHATDKSAGSITLAWNAAEGATSYQVWWVRQSDGQACDPVTTTGTSLTLSGLQPGTYTFWVATQCNGEASSWIGIEDVIIL
jgi:hypothetical protein